MTKQEIIDRILTIKKENGWNFMSCFINDQLKSFGKRPSKRRLSKLLNDCNK